MAGNDMYVETKDPAKRNITERFRDMGDGTYARQVYVVNTSPAIDNRPWSNQLSTTSFSAVTQAALMTQVNNYLAASTKRFVGLNQYQGGLVSLQFYATVIEMPDVPAA